MDSHSPPEKWFTFFGLVVVRRTDLLAATAFILSLSTIFYQLWLFVRGANPVMYPPDTLYVFFDKYANGVTATRVAGQLSFTNSGDVGHNAIIRDVAATVKVGARSIEENWLSFAMPKRQGTELEFDIKETAHPVVVNGGGASSYMVTFSPRVKDCAVTSPTGATCDQAADFVSDVDFLNLLSQQKTMTITFTAAVFDMRRPLKVECSTSVTEDMVLTLAKNDWYAARCIAVQ
jgi:hypothetical protein